MSGGTAALMPRRPLGRTGINVSELGFNAWVIGGGVNADALDPGPGEAKDEESLAALVKAFELGVNFVATSDSYGQGHSEILVGKAIKSSPRRVHVATQVGLVRRDPEPARQDFSPEHIRAACERSLNRLGITSVDLYLLQRPSRDVLADEAVWKVLHELKDSGKISHFGVSLNDPADGLLAMERGEVAALEVRYNLCCAQTAREFFTEAEKKGVGLLVREPLAGGLLTGRFSKEQLLPENDARRRRYSEAEISAALEKSAVTGALARDGRTAAQTAIKFALASVAVSSVTIGARNAEQAAEDFTASAAAELPPEELARCSK
jgi:aryl-alcohol dehydrogenase-like predicted oxidoreductase